MSESFLDPEEIMKLLAAEEEVRRLLSNPGKKQRERWVLDHWLAVTGTPTKEVVEGESPDFSVDGLQIEIVEVQEPNRRRGDELKNGMVEIAGGRYPEPTPVVEWDEVCSWGHVWIADSVVRKAEKYGEIAANWVLLIYANFLGSKDMDWLALRHRVASSVGTFAEIYILTAGGDNVIGIKP